MSDQNPPVDSELAKLIENANKLEAELEKLSPEERKARILAHFGLPEDASEADIEWAVQASVLKDFAEMPPEEIKEWEEAIKDSPLFRQALEAQGKDGGELGSDLSDLERALLGDAIPHYQPRMVVELIVNRVEDAKRKPVFHAIIPAIADTHKDSAPFTIAASKFEPEDVAVLLERATGDGIINPPVILLGEANQVDRALLSGWKQEDFDKFDLRDLVMMPRMITF